MATGHRVVNGLSRPMEHNKNIAGDSQMHVRSADGDPSLFQPLIPGDRHGIPVLERGRLHEIHAAAAHRAGALAFALAQGFAPHAGLSGDSGGAASRALFLVRPRGGGKARARLHGEGLARLGLDPAGLTIVEVAEGAVRGAADGTALLRAGLDAARCPALVGVVIESEGRLPAYDLTASRRLALAAERAGGRVVVVRIDAVPRPSAAFTRWTIASAPSVAPSSGLPGTAPDLVQPIGEAALIATLERRRGGLAGLDWRLEWDSDHGFFRPILPAPEPGNTPLRPPVRAPLPGAVVPLAGLRTGLEDHRGNNLHGTRAA
jgi:protein ImuA